MLNKYKITFILLITLLITSNSMKLKSKFIPLAEGTPISEDEISETLSSLALKRIYNRLPQIHFSSCALSAKFILLTVGGIEKKKDLPELKLTKNNTEDLNNIKQLLNKNYLIQIEFLPNHHMIIFKKNNKDLYILQGFQDIYTLNDWMADKEVMKPYMSIKDFFDKVELLINDNNTKLERDKMLIDLFLPEIFSNKAEDIDKVLNWFLNYRVSIANVNYAAYNFKENQNSTDFHKLWHEVDSHYILSDEQFFDFDKFK